MQLSTHFVMAVFIDKVVSQQNLSFPLKTVVLAGTCYLSHGILDKLARATYHPPEPLDDGFWEPYHKKFLPILTGAVTLAYIRKHGLAMLFSALPDLDWIVRDINRKYNRRIPGWEKPVLNESLHAFLDKVPIVNLLNRLPDLRFNPKGALVEVGLVVLLLGAIQFLDRKK